MGREESACKESSERLGSGFVPKHSIPGQEESRNLPAGIQPLVPFPSDFCKCFRLPLAAARSASRKERCVQAGGGCQLPKATSVQPQACLPAPTACLLKQILGREPQYPCSHPGC